MNYIDARPGEVFTFNEMQIEIREDLRSDPDGQKEFFNPLTLVNKEDDDDFGSNENNSLTPQGKTPKPETKEERAIRLKQEEWERKAEEMTENNT